MIRLVLLFSLLSPLSASAGEISAPGRREPRDLPLASRYCPAPAHLPIGCCPAGDAFNSCGDHRSCIDPELPGCGEITPFGKTVQCFCKVR